MLGEGVDELGHAGFVFEDGGDVIEEDAGLGEVGHGADEGLEVFAVVGGGGLGGGGGSDQSWGEGQEKQVLHCVQDDNSKKLPGSLNFEEVKGGGLGCGEFVFDDGVDAAAARAFVEFGAEFSKGPGFAGGEDLDLSGVGVADPSAQAKFGSFAMDEPAKAYALHTPANEKVEHHFEFLVSQRHGELSNKNGDGMKAEAAGKYNSTREIRVPFIISLNGRKSHPPDITPRSRHDPA
jgi:hypothetical protein